MKRPRLIRLEIAEGLESRHEICKACPSLRKPLESYFRSDCAKCNCVGKDLMYACPAGKFGDLNPNGESIWQTS